MAFCMNCGAELEEGVRFCTNCGTPVAQEAEAADLTPDAEEQAAQPGVPAQSPQAPGATQTPSPAKPRPRVPIVAIIVAAAVVVAGVGAWVWFAFLAPIPIDEGTFPDVAVRNVVAEQLDADGNGELSRDEANAVTEFSVDGAANLDGVSHFPNLTYLSVRGTALGSVDLAPFGALETFVTEAPLEHVDVSHNPNLGELGVADTTVVSGLEATELEETWLPMGFSYQYGKEGEALEDYEGPSVTRDAAGTPTSYKNVWYSRGTGEKSTATTTYQFDDAGKVASATIENQYSSTGDVSQDTETFAYDDAGRLASVERQTSYDTSTTEYAYGTNGELLSSRTSSSGSTYTTSMNVNYDDAGRPISITSSYNDEAPETLITYGYDDAGRLSSCSNIPAKSYVYADHTLSYDEEGRVVKAVVKPGDPIYDSSPSVYDYTITVEYAYDEGGRIASATSTADYGSGSPSTRTAACSYDDHGNLVAVDVTIDPATSTGDVYHTIYETSWSRFFTKKGAPEPQQVLYFVPCYDTMIFDQLSFEPYRPEIPALEAADVAFSYNAQSLDYY